MKTIVDALTFDDVLLLPDESDVIPADVSIETSLSKSITLSLPILSAAMDTVSGQAMGQAMAKNGGMAVIHRNMSPQQQADIIKNIRQDNLNIAAAIGTGEENLERARLLIDAGVTMIVVDTAHGHSKNVLNQVESVKNLPSCPTLCAGNIATGKAAEALSNAGADCVKVGVGPGSICTTRIVAGVGVPQLSAIINVAEICRQKNIAVIADGGIRHSGDIVKALAAGANAVMVGSLLAGTDEAPGETVTLNGQSYKAYRGMGSIGAMQEGSADRYFQKSTKDAKKLVAEGVEGLTHAKGAVEDILHQLAGGLRSGMGYVGAKDLDDLFHRGAFVKITNAGLKESHVHDLAGMHAAPNYRG